MAVPFRVGVMQLTMEPLEEMLASARAMDEAGMAAPDGAKLRQRHAAVAAGGDGDRAGIEDAADRRLDALEGIDDPPGREPDIAAIDQAEPFASVHAASYRALYDLADLERSRFVASTGQSGNPLSSHYRDLSSLWADGRTIPIATRPEVYGRDAIGRLTLLPAG